MLRPPGPATKSPAPRCRIPSCSCIPQRVTTHRAAVIEFQYMRRARRPFVAMMRGDDAAAARGQPFVEPPREIRARGAIQPRKWLVEQRQRRLARPGACEQYAPRLPIGHFCELARAQSMNAESPQCALRVATIRGGDFVV